MPAFHINSILECLLESQLPADAHGKAANDGLSTWASTTHAGDPDGVLAPCFSLAQTWLFGE